MTFPQEYNIQHSQIRVHPYNVHWLMGQGLSQSLHVSIRQVKNDFISSIIDHMHFETTGQNSSERKLRRKKKCQPE